MAEGGLRIRCRYDEDEFRSLEELGLHLLVNHDTKNMRVDAECPVCDLRFVSTKELGKHIMKDHVRAK